jgi:hypothetical protein
MSNDEKKNESIPAHTDDYYEAIASQEELYLEEVEENLRAILTSKTNTAYREAGSFDEQLDLAAEDLLTGDSDDPPLSENNRRNAKQATIVRKFALATLGTQRIH